MDKKESQKLRETRINSGAKESDIESDIEEDIKNPYIPASGDRKGLKKIPLYRR